MNFIESEALDKYFKFQQIKRPPGTNMTKKEGIINQLGVKYPKDSISIEGSVSSNLTWRILEFLKSHDPPCYTLVSDKPTVGG
jgi:hypothetical protein